MWCVCVCVVFWGCVVKKYGCVCIVCVNSLCVVLNLYLFWIFGWLMCMYWSLCEFYVCVCCVLVVVCLNVC